MEVKKIVPNWPRRIENINGESFAVTGPEEYYVSDKVNDREYHIILRWNKKELEIAMVNNLVIEREILAKAKKPITYADEKYLIEDLANFHDWIVGNGMENAQYMYFSELCQMKAEGTIKAFGHGSLL